jgi:hypothetical protein
MPDDNDNLRNGSVSPLEGTFGSDIMFAANLAYTGMTLQALGAFASLTPGTEGPISGAALSGFRPALGLGLVAAGLNAIMGGPQPKAPAPAAPKG